MSLDGFSMSPLVAELNRQLTGGRIDKIFQPAKNMIIIWIRQPGETFRLRISTNAAQPHLNLSEQQIENPAVPPVFCMVLRKHLEDGRIAGIVQHKSDRIVFIHIDIRGAQDTILTKTLVVELMGKHSNAILMQNDLIIDALRRIGPDISRIRQIAPGRQYLLPPGQEKPDIFLTAPAAFTARVLTEPTLPLVKAILQAGQGIGPVTAKELAWRAGFSPTAVVETLPETAAGVLTDAVTAITTPVKEGAIVPTVVTETTGRLLGIAAFPLKHLAEYDSRHFPSMSAALDFASQLVVQFSPPDKDRLTKLVGNESAKLEKKLHLLTGELADAGLAGDYRKSGDILMANLHRQPQRATEITLTDLYCTLPEQSLITISIDPALSLLDNARQYYAKYNKLKRAQVSLASQIEQTRQELQYLASIEVSLENALIAGDVSDIRAELISAGYVRDTRKRRQSLRRSGPLKVLAPGGSEILIGRNNYQNDELTFKQAQPDDLWFHTKELPGSHVILRTGRQPAVDAAVTLAAQLAAYFSKGRNSTKVPVDYTKRRNVKKPSGAKPGFVIYTSQKTLYVSPEQEYLEQLLQQAASPAKQQPENLL